MIAEGNHFNTMIFIIRSKFRYIFLKGLPISLQKKLINRGITQGYNNRNIDLYRSEPFLMISYMNMYYIFQKIREMVVIDKHRTAELERAIAADDKRKQKQNPNQIPGASV